MKYLVILLITQACSSFQNKTCTATLCKIENIYNNRYVSNQRVCYCVKWETIDEKVN